MLIKNNMLIKLFLSILYLVVVGKVSAAPDPNFHIYLMFGQSNMEGAAPIENQDRITNSRVKVMADLNCSNLGRIYGNWYTASPPLNRCGSGLGPGDYFGKTMADAMPSSVTIGLVPAAVSGTPIELYQKSAPIGRNNQNIPSQFNGGYAWLLDMAKKAQQVGVIKGIIFHQGESDTSDPLWKHQVKEIVTDLRKDLGIGDVPFLAGELLYADYQSCCHWHNAEVNKLPGLIPNAYVVSAMGLPGMDVYHFTTASYRELGRRYAQIMLEKIDRNSAISSSSRSSSSSSRSSISSSARSSSSSRSSSVSRSSSSARSSANSSAVSGNGKCVYSVTNDWGNGFTASIKITNTGSNAISGWSVSWRYTDASRVTNLWNGVVTGSNPYTVTHLDWNKTIQPGQSVEFGFQGTKSGGTAAVPSVTGNLCN
jgi:Carbohydrate esterase, sialic acid-specific acetylesterase/Cellulose binding domain